MMGMVSPSRGGCGGKGEVGEFTVTKSQDEWSQGGQWVSFIFTGTRTPDRTIAPKLPQPDCEHDA